MRPAFLLALFCLGCARHFESKLDLSREQQTRSDTTSQTDTTTRTVREGGALDVIWFGDDGTPKKQLHRESVKTTRDAETQAKVKAVLQLDLDEDADAESEGDSKPKIPSLLGMLLGNWPYALLGVAAIAIITMVGFRKSGVVQRLAKFLPFPFSLLAIAVPAPAETPKE